MKNIKYLFLGLVTLGLLASCESFLADDDINLDPNKPSDVPVNAILPNIEIRLVDVYGGDTSRFNTMIAQQVEGVARQWSSFNNYSGLTPNRFGTAWDNFYENILIEVNNMILIANERGYNHYEGVGKVLKAYALMTMTDLWGDIPYSEAALVGDTPLNLNPSFDSRASIYTEVFSLLSSANSLLTGSNGGLAVGSDDVLYGGNTSAWLKAIKAIEARAHLHQGNNSAALTAARASFESPDDNMSYTYNSSQQAGWWRFNDGRTGDIEFHPTLRGIMSGLNDTDRLGVLDQTFITSHPYFKANATVALISYREVQFMIAELETAGSAAKHEAYMQGIEASFAEVGLGETEYNSYIANSSVDPGVAGLTNDHVMTQKYIGLFGQPQVFNDMRRQPNLEPYSNMAPTSGTQLPVRWNYPADELLFNENAAGYVTTHTLFSPSIF